VVAANKRIRSAPSAGHRSEDAVPAEQPGARSRQGAATPSTLPTIITGWVQPKVVVWLMPAIAQTRHTDHHGRR
jgi:hypothetical protein